jgi:hypothetical protein
MKGREIIGVRLGLKQMGAAELVAAKCGMKPAEWVKMLILEAIEGEANHGVMNYTRPVVESATGDQVERAEPQPSPSAEAPEVPSGQLSDEPEEESLSPVEILRRARERAQTEGIVRPDGSVHRVAASYVPPKSWAELTPQQRQNLGAEWIHRVPLPEGFPGWQNAEKLAWMDENWSLTESRGEE